MRMLLPKIVRRLLAPTPTVRRLLVALAAILLGAGTAAAQDTTCNDGDIAWVSSAVNADVGLASGAGRCATNTVAGAEYNNISAPWGIQAAFDCLCQGLTIRILGDTGNYGSATNSWNNRFDATKEVVPGVLAPQVEVIGYADSSTSCEVDNTSAGCPVEINFTGGTDDGFEFTQQEYSVFGLRLTGAADDCLVDSAGDNMFAGMELDNCDGDGLHVQTFNSHTFVRGYIHAIGDSSTVDAAIRDASSINSAHHDYAYNYIRDITGFGIQFTTSGMMVMHNIFYDTANDCVSVNGLGSFFGFNTMRECGGDGVDLQTGASGNAEVNYYYFNLITGAGGWAFNDGGRTTQNGGAIVYNVMGGNVSGDINPANNWMFIQDNVTGATVVYASTSDHTPTSGAELTVTFPRGLTTVTINAGAVSEGGGAATAGGGGGGVFVPGGPR